MSSFERKKRKIIPEQFKNHSKLILRSYTLGTQKSRTASIPNWLKKTTISQFHSWRGTWKAAENENVSQKENIFGSLKVRHVKFCCMLSEKEKPTLEYIQLKSSKLQTLYLIHVKHAHLSCTYFRSLCFILSLPPCLIFKNACQRSEHHDFNILVSK